MIIQVSLENSNFFYKHVSVHYHIMHYHYLKLNSDKKKNHTNLFLVVDFLVVIVIMRTLHDSVLSAYP